MTIVRNFSSGNVHCCCFRTWYRNASTKTTAESKVKSVKKKYSDSVNLPKTKFPMRIEAHKRAAHDKFIYEKCRFSSIYSWQREHAKEPDFVLHDGPPYANGKPHMGHALNKILKDIILRHKVLQGQKVHFIPGWDCHGLPIELKALSSSHGSASELSPLEVRAKARKFARKAIEEQKTTFKSWGIMADWNNTYQTYDKKYVKNQINQFFDMYQKGLIYRAHKPVFWSPSSRTALAEAELEYNSSHCSPAVTVRFRIEKLSSHLREIIPSGINEVYLLVWTTTPWTLPVTRGVCYNSRVTYIVARMNHSNTEAYILGADCLENLKKKTGVEFNVISSFKGDALSDTFYDHPLKKGCRLPLLPSDHVSTNKGTGLVHLSPAHGHDDFLVALKHEISVDCLVDEDGCYMSEIGPELQGLHVLTSGNEKVLHLLQNDIFHQEKYIHNYPYDWRTKKPVIIRASKQWFIDTDTIKQKAISILRDVTILPEKIGGTSQLISQLDKRPYWCISRQRVWGVPIPVLYSQSNTDVIVSRSLIDNYCALLDEHGPDFWWLLPVEKLAGNCLSSLNVNSKDIEKSKDILDIWFDSGLTWSAVLDGKESDLCLEGVDQITGWFQSSLMTSVALREKSPYRTLFVHGFAVDESGRKMSKSLGNVVDPVEVIEGSATLPALGNDVLRWWVASHGTQHRLISISNSLLNNSADSVQKIRIVLRFILGSINDLPPQTTMNNNDFFILDKYILHLLFGLEKEVTAMYEIYQFNSVCKIITNFVTNELSALYCHLIKDRLYCELPDSPKRRACQIVLSHVLEGVTHLIAPILPFLAEEVSLHYAPYADVGVFRSGVWKPQTEWENSDICNVMSQVLKLRSSLHKESNETNVSKLSVKITAASTTLQSLKLFQAEDVSYDSQLTELLQVSSAQLIESNEYQTNDQYQIACEPSEKYLCPRCRRYTADETDTLCLHCEEITRKQEIQQAQSI